MSTIKELALELDQDFENLSTTSMAWSEKTWAEQVAGGRFEGAVTFDHGFIYWFDSYAAVVAAKSILKELEADYAVIFDTATMDWAITSNYITIGWRD